MSSSLQARVLLALAAMALCACPKNPPGPDAGPPPDGGPADAGADAGSSPDLGQPQVSRSLALSSDGKTLWVLNPESDSISEVNVATRALVHEHLLGAARPGLSDAGRYDPALRPRSVALLAGQAKAYVAAQSANQVLVLSTTTGAVVKAIPTGAEPVSVVASADGRWVFVVNHEGASVQKIDTTLDAVVGTLPVSEHPWGASLRADGSALYVTHLLLKPGVTVVDTASFALRQFTILPELLPDVSQNKLIPNGQVRGAYTAVPRPNDGELWVPHLLLSTNTAQPQLDFQSTVFPTVSRVSPGGLALDNRILFRPSTVPGATGSFTDSVSGPRDVAFTPDGTTALVALAQSEDVMVFDAVTGFEVGLIRPTPSAMLEGILVDASGAHAYLQGRVSHNVTVLSLSGGQWAVDGSPIECLEQDPMPADLRRGMRLFYSANIAFAPLTQNFWVACGTCHLEGQSDAVVWRFAQGPRDTPSNAGGPINTGFLFRQAVRNDVVDYDETIRVEQGGNFSSGNPAQRVDLQALANFTNYAIPFPQNPYLPAGGALNPSQLHGQLLFNNYCATCHSGPYFTDSGKGNPSLALCDLPNVILHDVGTCVDGGSFPDKPRPVYDGGCQRSACDFDTPSLRGVFATAPYFHDGSAATLDDAVAHFDRFLGLGLSASDRADLVAYLQTL